MHFRFNDKRTAQAAALLLKLHGGSMDILPLIKLLYLADRKKLLDKGVSLTGDVMVSMTNGPALSHVYNLIKRETKGPSEWFNLIGPRVGNAVALLDVHSELPAGALSKDDIQLLTEMHTLHGGKTVKELIDYTHSLGEWREPPGRSTLPITPESILRAEKFSEEQIAAVAAEQVPWPGA